MIRARSVGDVLEFRVATGMSAARRAATWLVIRASRGETTMVMPWSITAGSWKQRLLPNEVAAWTKTSWPQRAARIISRWNGLIIVSKQRLQFL